MKRLLLLPLLALMFGCAQNHFNVPTEHFAAKVKVLGVAPIIVDVNSDIRHPEKDRLVALLADMNRKYEQQLVRKLKVTGDFYTVVLLDGEPQRIFDNLYFRSEKRDDATIRYNKYFWKTDELRDYLKKNNLDAVMLLVVSGLTQNEKVYSNTLLSSRTSDYNNLILTAQILDGDGTILWEYPNFRDSILAYSPLINLQYPDFNEAEANFSGEADLKFKTIDGIRRTLDQRRKDLLMRETQESEVYGKQFDDIVSLLKYDADEEKKDAAPINKPAPQPEQPKPAEQAAKPAGISPPAAEPPAAPAAPATDEIVPAKGGTL
ncbi:MAG: hypothetical protein P4L44_05610 [Oryzomonas sp.]|uniref:hypothetical protein n=1 Tax=Oryzomonas sp. TaxID=2855186 RepID=UPI0028476C43|nr:hypothetical protein [Oryzomonas sp.]MDR3579415.1 hypothetical protein [Oryzomonas sp.]